MMFQAPTYKWGEIFHCIYDCYGNISTHLCMNIVIIMMLFAKHSVNNKKEKIFKKRREKLLKINNNKSK